MVGQDSWSGRMESTGGPNLSAMVWLGAMPPIEHSGLRRLGSNSGSLRRVFYLEGSGALSGNVVL
jgi:hypothetical protein